MALDCRKRTRTNRNLLRELLSENPWLWGVTNRWFPGRDYLEFKRLTISILKELTFSKITDLGGSSWFVYQRIRNGVEQVTDVGEYADRRGTPMAPIIRNYPGVVFLVELKFDRGKRGYRHFILYEVRRASRLKSLCERALEIDGDILAEKKPVSKKRARAVVKISLQALR